MALHAGGVAQPIIRKFAFIDASNVIRGLCEKLGNNLLRADNPPREAIDLIRCLVFTLVGHERLNRYYWIGPCAGAAENRTNLAEILRTPMVAGQTGYQGNEIIFEPVLRNKPQNEGEKGKGVDSALVLTMLTNAFNGNYQVGWLFSGDTDFSELVTELKRYGPMIYGASFESRCKNQDFRHLFDNFSLLDQFFDHAGPWTDLIAKLKKALERKP